MSNAMVLNEWFHNCRDDSRTQACWTLACGTLACGLSRVGTLACGDFSVWRLYPMNK